MSGGAILPEGWPRPRGYSNGIAASGRVLFVSGQIGWDPLTERVVATDFASQTRQALENVLAVLRAGGAGPGQVTRLTWYVTDLDAYRAARTEVGQTFRSLFGGHYPAMSVVQVSALLEPGALVEIEATAVVGA
ncbi:MAG: RidA family protein [Gemmatimonadetes bacterium]|nr:RidA family protein [Gemmatimonadota bacterium]